MHIVPHKHKNPIVAQSISIMTIVSILDYVIYFSFL